MPKEILSNLGQGGIGLSGQGPGSVFAALREMQGLNMSLLAGVGAGLKNDLAAIRREDTIVGALNNNLGTITDVTATTVISPVEATGTVTFGAGGSVAADTVTVNGKVYTAVVAPADFTQYIVSSVVATAAASLAAAINAREASGLNTVTATPLAGAVTVNATAEGTGPNAYTLAETGANTSVSGATLSGGTSTGGIAVVGATNQVILFWFNKK